MTFYPWPSWESEMSGPVLSVVHTTRHLLKYVQSPAPPFLLLWRQLIPTCTQRQGWAEWPKQRQSSWPWWLRPAEWFSLCPHGHRGLAEMGCFLRGHLAGLCSHPSNRRTGISTWFRRGFSFFFFDRKTAHQSLKCKQALMHMMNLQHKMYSHLFTTMFTSYVSRQSTCR